MLKNISIILEDIKFRHTVFAMPFAVISAFLASQGMPPVNKFLWILLAMAGARTSAMIFNRIVDAGIDRKNPRTKDRALPSEKISTGQYSIFLLAAVCVFILSCYALNMLCLYLSPLALFVIFFYSFTKRFTALSHFFLGLALSFAPVGAWIAINGEISVIPIVLGCAVIFWLAGFDIIYSCQDVEFDTEYNLWSFPRKYGVERSLQLAMIFHILMVIFLLSLTVVNTLGLIYLTGVILVGFLLCYEHSLVNPGDLAKVNIAFFNVNGVISLLLMSVVIIDCLIDFQF